jgi:hypothetical protein
MSAQTRGEKSVAAVPSSGTGSSRPGSPREAVPGPAKDDRKGSPLDFLRVGAEAADWNDPNVPVGDAPPVPRWPLYVWVTLWLAWIAFLVAMVIIRLRGPRV